ncbi:MAG: hypothetical protein QXD46_05830 [Thermofilum sp.]
MERLASSEGRKLGAGGWVEGRGAPAALRRVRVGAGAQAAAGTPPVPTSSRCHA